MADVNYRVENVSYANEGVVVSRPNWGSIWAGTFTFIAIWAIFGMLGTAIFATTANPAATHPVTGMNVGMSIWAVVLTIVAMFVAGRVTGQTAGPVPSVRMHAIVMFGLSVTAALLVVVLGGSALTAVPAGGTGAGIATTSYLIGTVTDLAWPLFFALILGFCAAIGGASTVGKELPRHTVLHQQPSHA